MEPTELEQLGIQLYSEKDWHTSLATALGVTARTVRGWAKGDAPVPNPAAAAIRCFVAHKYMKSFDPVKFYWKKD